MSRSEERGRRKPGKRRHLWCAAAVLGLAAAGCSHTPVAQSKDPLLEPPALGDPTRPPPPPPSQQGNAGVPPIPTTLSATSTATLASLPGSRPLSIPERSSADGTPGQLTNTARSNPVPGEPLPPRVLEVPADTGAPAAPNSGWAPGAASAQAIPPPVVPVSSPPPAAVATQIVTTDNFARLLADRGYTLQHLKQSSLPQGILVTCIATPAGSAEQSVFEVTAPSFDDAGQAILREADRRGAA